MISKALSSQFKSGGQSIVIKANDALPIFCSECLAYFRNSESKNKTRNTWLGIPSRSEYLKQKLPRGFKKYDYLRLFTSIRNRNRTPVKPTCGFLPATAGENIVLSARLCIVLWIWDLFLGKLFGHLDMAAVAPREIILLLLSLSTFNNF